MNPISQCCSDISSSSEYFRALFKPEWHASTQNLFLETNKQFGNTFLKWIYGIHEFSNTKSALLHLLRLSDFHQISGLRIAVSTRLPSFFHCMTVEELSEVFTFANGSNELPLRKKVLKVLLQKDIFQKFVSQHAFIYLTPAEKIKIFHEKYPCYNPENLLSIIEQVLIPKAEEIRDRLKRMEKWALKIRQNKTLEISEDDLRERLDDYSDEISELKELSCQFFFAANLQDCVQKEFVGSFRYSMEKEIKEIEKLLDYVEEEVYLPMILMECEDVILD